MRVSSRQFLSLQHRRAYSLNLLILLKHRLARRLLRYHDMQSKVIALLAPEGSREATLLVRRARRPIRAGKNRCPLGRGRAACRPLCPAPVHTARALEALAAKG